MRTKKSYKKDLLLNDLNLTGIKSECVFHLIPSFYLIDNFSADIMHDLLEAVCVFDIASLINHYISEKKYFNLDDLTNRMKLHNRRLTESNSIPPEILEKDLKSNSIRMSAAEMYAFVRHFGIIFGDLVPIEDSAW